MNMRLANMALLSLLIVASQAAQAADNGYCNEQIMMDQIAGVYYRPLNGSLVFDPAAAGSLLVKHSNENGLEVVITRTPCMQGGYRLSRTILERDSSGTPKSLRSRFGFQMDQCKEFGKMVESPNVYEDLATFKTINGKCAPYTKITGVQGKRYLRWTGPLCHKLNQLSIDSGLTGQQGVACQNILTQAADAYKNALIQVSKGDPEIHSYEKLPNTNSLSALYGLMTDCGAMPNQFDPTRAGRGSEVFKDEGIWGPKPTGGTSSEATKNTAGTALSS